MTVSAIIANSIVQLLCLCCQINYVQVRVWVQAVCCQVWGRKMSMLIRQLDSFMWGILHPKNICMHIFLYPRPTKLEGGGYTGFTLSVRRSVRPSVCRHGFRSISQVCFEISISNFICMLMVAIGRSLLIFSDVTFKMAACRPYWIFWFPNSNFTLALNINFKLQRHNTYVYG